MSVFRVSKNKNYTVMSNVHLQDNRLSYKAKGLLSVMLSLPKDWDFTETGLAKISKDSRDGVRTAIIELEECGYLKRTRNKDERGRFLNTVYDVFEKPMLEKPMLEKPMLEKPMLEKPMLEKPMLEKPTQLNTKEQSTKLKSTKEQSTYYLQIKDLFNETCVSFPRVQSLSDNRKKAIKARLNSGYTEEDFKRLFEEAEKSSFLKGKNNRNWQATFDWLIKDSNMAKVLDGNYRDKGAAKPEKKSSYDINELEKRLCENFEN